MLKTSYDKQDDIPENLRGAYIQKDNKWVLDDLDNSHPVVTKRDELLRDNTTLKSQNTRLQNDKASLEQNVLPAGHKAVPEADAELIEVVKPLGDKKAVTALIDEHKTLKAKDESVEHGKSIKRALELAGFKATEENVEAVKAISASLGIKPEFKEETIDGKKVEKPYVADKLFTDYVEATPALKALTSVLKGGTAPNPVNTEAGAGNRGTQGSGNGGQTKTETYRFQSAGDVQW